VAVVGMLWGVSCATSKYCMAVGDFVPKNPFGVQLDRPFVEQYSRE
jgi:hypothetical protein